MPTYRTTVPSDGNPEGIVARLIDQHYPDLKEAEVTIEILFAHARRDDSGEPTGEALKLHGYPALAIVKVNGLQDRVEGKKDATIRINGDAWPDMTDQRREALLMHELMHLQIVRDDEGQIQSDDCGRPKLKVRLHDFEIGGFYSVIEKYDMAAPEAEAAAMLGRSLKQMEFDWTGDMGSEVPELKAV